MCTCSAPESPKGTEPSVEAKPAVDPAAIQAEVEAAMKDYGKAITSGDIEGTLDGLTDDVHILQANRNQKGKEVKDMFRGLLTAYKVVEFDLRPIEFSRRAMMLRTEPSNTTRPPKVKARPCMTAATSGFAGRRAATASGGTLTLWPHRVCCRSKTSRNTCPEDAATETCVAVASFRRDDS